MDSIPQIVIIIGIFAVVAAVYFISRRTSQDGPSVPVYPPQAPYVPPMPSPVPLPTPVPPSQPVVPPEQPAPVMMSTVYIDRDDLMKSIGTTGTVMAVTLDGTVVHNGFGPALAYYTQANGSVSIYKPAAPDAPAEVAPAAGQAEVNPAYYPGTSTAPSILAKVQQQMATKAGYSSPQAVINAWNALSAASDPDLARNQFLNGSKGGAIHNLLLNAGVLTAGEVNRLAYGSDGKLVTPELHAQIAELTKEP